MVSYSTPEINESSHLKNYTIASIYRKPKVLTVTLLFGDYVHKSPPVKNSEGIVDAVDYYFAPRSIFGISLRSAGAVGKKMHMAFVLKACGPGEIGNVVIGISPGAQVLASTLTRDTTPKLLFALEKLKSAGIELAELSEENYRRLNGLLDVRIDASYFVRELIDKVPN